VLDFYKDINLVIFMRSYLLALLVMLVLLSGCQSTEQPLQPSDTPQAPIIFNHFKALLTVK